MENRETPESEKRYLDHIAYYIRTNLTYNLGKIMNEKNKEIIESNIKSTLSKQVKDGVLQAASVNNVQILWNSWNFKKKLKWLFYNKFPIIRHQSKTIRAYIEEVNALKYEINELHPGDIHSYLVIPDHLIPNPNSIIVSDIKVFPARSLEFINLNIKFDKEK